MRVLMGLLVATLVTLFAGQAMAQADAQAQKCKQLAGVDFGDIVDAPSSILSATFKGSACEIDGYVQPNVGFALRLPAAWNGKFGEVGCGGFCGAVLPQLCDDMLARGYACLTSDLGHKSTGNDGKWAYNNLQAEIDFASRATHVLAVAGKAIAEHYYSKAPTRAYFLGCSTGGRQGFFQAQHFPDDFDGIVAGAPVSRITGVGMANTWATMAMLKDGKPLFKFDDMTVLHDAVLARCDAIDGHKDGVIDDPRKCTFDAGSLGCMARSTGACFNADQVAAIRKIYGGPVNSKGEKLFAGGQQPGSELDWRVFIATASSAAGVHGFMQDMFRYMMFTPDPGPLWSLKDFDWDKDPPRLALMESLYNAENPDMRKFKARGGKLIAYQGWSDPLILPENVIDFYGLTERTMGGPAATRDFFRLFMVPGMGHCGGGSGPFTVDYLAYLENWVEKGAAPDAVVAKSATAERTLQAYPLPAN